MNLILNFNHFKKLPLQKYNKFYLGLRIGKTVDLKQKNLKQKL